MIFIETWVYNLSMLSSQLITLSNSNGSDSVISLVLPPLLCYYGYSDLIQIPNFYTTLLST